MHYDPETNIMSWEIGKGAISRALLVGKLIIHVSANGQPILIEMLDASKLVGQFDKIKGMKEITLANQNIAD